MNGERGATRRRTGFILDNTISNHLALIAKTEVEYFDGETQMTLEV